MKAAIYARQSLDKSGDAAAVSRQVTECRELAQRNGWDVVETYQDNDRSATNGKPRPAWSRLLEDLAAGRHDVLICWHTDRLYRRLKDLVALVELAEKRSLRIATVKSSDLDLSTPAGRMVASLLGSVASYETEQKAARQVAANRQRAQSGVVLWTRRPFGFDRDGDKVKVNRKEAAELRKAAKKVLAGATLAGIVRDLNDRDIVTSTGGRWSVTSLRRALLNPRAAGRIVSKGQHYGSDGPSIFDAETADRLAAVLRDPARKKIPDAPTAKYLLSGLVRCGRPDCDAVMFATSNTPGKRVRKDGTVKKHQTVKVYRCTSFHATRRLDLVDEVVMGVLCQRLTRPDAAALLDSDVDVTALRERVVELRQRRDGIASLLGDGLLSPDAARAQATRLTADIESVERDLAAATGTDPVAALVGADDVAARLAGLSLRELRQVVRTLMTVRILPAGKGIRFDPAQVAIEWKASG